MTGMAQIVQLWFQSANSVPIEAIEAVVSRDTLSRWYKKCRKVFSRAEYALLKMVGTIEAPILVVESYFVGHRKYNKVFSFRRTPVVA